MTAQTGPILAAELRPSVRQLRLQNGLQLVWEEDHRQPLVAIEARIKGGLRAEGKYVGTGITHFIEHMLFKGTPSRPPGSIEQEVRRYGGTINAFTSMDTTGVTLFVESRYLKEGLELVADILQHAVFDQAELDKERAVIISEIQMNLDDPDRRIHQLFWSRHYLEHPYQHPILGYQPLLEGLTVTDLQSFYAAQYLPQNIAVACVGDLDGAAFEALAKSLFDAWPRGLVDPSQQLVPAEPPSASAKSAVVELPIQSAYVALGFSSVRIADPDVYPLDVLANILGHGRSARLYERIVRRKRLADAVAAWNYTPFDPGIFGIQFRTDPAKVEEATAAILAAIEEISQDGVTDDELRKAKAMTSADYLFDLQTVEGRAGDLANSLTLTGDPLFSRQYLARIDAVTADQVRDAARRHCQRSTMTTAVIRPHGTGPAVDAGAPKGSVVVTKRVLASGAAALVGVDRTLPIAAVVVAFRGGVRVEDEAHEGLSNLVAQMLTKGTKKHSALDIAQRVESLGGSLEPFSGRDGFGLMLQLLAKDVDEGIALMHELVSEAAFPEAEVAIQRDLIAKQLKAQEDEIFDVGGQLLRRTLFTEHPYRFHPLGRKDTLPAMTRDDCLRFSNTWLAPANMVVSVFGDIQPDAVGKRLDGSFGKSRGNTPPWPAALPQDPLESIRQRQEPMEREQALIMLGFRGSTHTGADRHPLDVMTAILSGMAGRLFQAVREEHGLAYTLGASNIPGWDPGYVVVYAATRPDQQAKVLEVLEEQLRLTQSEGFTAEELDQAKRYLTGLHRMDVQQLTGLARRSALDELYGLGYDAWSTYEQKIASVTLESVNEAAKRYLTLERRAQVIVSPNGHGP